MIPDRGGSSPFASSTKILAAASLFVLTTTSDPAAGSTSSDGSANSPTIYGTDDRREVYELEQDHFLRRAARGSLIAIGRRDWLLDDGGEIRLAAPSAGEHFGLCAEERFSEQPAFALCSGVAVTRNEVLTAAHCLKAAALSELVALSGFYYDAPGVLAPLRRENVHDIREVLDEDAAGYAWLGLSGPTELEPSVIATEAIAAGESIMSLNHGGGVPAKVDSGGRAFAVDDRAFWTTVDAFGGASGSPIFSNAGNLLGILLSGSNDYRTTTRGCRTAIELADVEANANEFVPRVNVALDRRCHDHPEVEICAGERSTVGNGISCTLRHGKPPLGSSNWIYACAAMCLVARRRSPHPRACRSLKARST